MLSAFPSFTWEEALHEYFLHLQATRAKKTQHYYEVQVGGLARWATEQEMPFVGFGKRHMDRYLVSRAEAGKAQLTLHHDAVCAKPFFRWCQKNDIVERSPLADYEVRRAPRTTSGTPPKTPAAATPRSPGASSTATAATRSSWACLTRRPASGRCFR